MNEEIVARLEALQISCERLYRIRLLKKGYIPDANASEGGLGSSRFAKNSSMGSQSHDPEEYVCIAMFNDLHDMTFAQIFEEVMEFADGEPGEYKIEIYYWDGDIVHPGQKGSAMGAKEHFLYDYNPYGDVVRMVDPIFFVI